MNRAARQAVARAALVTDAFCQLWPRAFIRTRRRPPLAARCRHWQPDHRQRSPQLRHSSAASRHPLWANSGLVHRSKVRKIKRGNSVARDMTGG